MVQSEAEKQEYHKKYYLENRERILKYQRMKKVKEDPNYGRKINSKAKLIKFLNELMADGQARSNKEIMNAVKDRGGNMKLSIYKVTNHLRMHCNCERTDDGKWKLKGSEENEKNVND